MRELPEHDARNVLCAEQQIMRHWQQGVSISRNRKMRLEKRLRQLAQMRTAKQRKRLANAPSREPKMPPWYALELGLRDKVTGEVAWVDFKSLRDAMRRLGVVRRLYEPGLDKRAVSRLCSPQRSGPRASSAQAKL
jgi:hypothetical protein